MKILSLLILFVLASCSRSIVDNTLKLGTGVPADTIIESSQGAANNPQIKYNFTSGTWQFSDDGTTFVEYANASDISTALGDYVTLTTSQTISGAKTFSGVTTLNQMVAVSTTEGSHPAPTMTEAQRDLISGMSAGDMVFNSDSGKLNYYDGAAWEEVGSGSGGGGGIPLLSKGALITSDGTTNGEFTCADGEKLEWDSAEASGVKCVAAASGGKYSVLVSGPLDQFSSTTSSSYVDNATITWTSTSTNPVKITGVPKIYSETTTMGRVFYYMTSCIGAICNARIDIALTDVSNSIKAHQQFGEQWVQHSNDGINVDLGCGVLSFIYTETVVGSNTLKIRIKRGSSGGTANVHIINCDYLVQEI
jgi:hypothetical protein